MLLDADIIPEVMEIIKPNDFYKSANLEIYSAISDMVRLNQPVDIITVSERLNVNGTLDQIGGLEYLSNITSSVPTTRNAKYYSGIVLEKSKLRQLLKSCAEASNMAYDNQSSSAIQERMLATLLESKSENKLIGIESLAKAVKLNIEDRIKNKGTLPGIPTHFRYWDYKTKGLEKGLLYVLGARASMGKTALLLCIILYITKYLKIPVQFFSLEMKATKIVNRLTSMISDIPSQNINLGNIDTSEMKRIESALKVVEDLPLVIDDTPGLSLSELTARAMRQKLKNPNLGLICIDHLSEMDKEGKDERIAISDNCRGIKRLAKNLDIPVILLTQLNRAVEGRNSKKPQLSDLRESGAIEEVADVVSLLYRDSYYDESKRGNREDAELIVAKCRDGETGSVNLHWYPSILTFKNPEYQPIKNEPAWTKRDKDNDKPF